MTSNYTSTWNISWPLITPQRETFHALRIHFNFPNLAHFMVLHSTFIQLFCRITTFHIIQSENYNCQDFIVFKAIILQCFFSNSHFMISKCMNFQHCNISWRLESMDRNMHFLVSFQFLQCLWMFVICFYKPPKSNVMSYGLIC
mgnify:FL=1